MDSQKKFVSHLYWMEMFTCWCVKLFIFHQDHRLGQGLGPNGYSGLNGLPCIAGWKRFVVYGYKSVKLFITHLDARNLGFNAHWYHMDLPKKRFVLSVACFTSFWMEHLSHLLGPKENQVIVDIGILWAHQKLVCLALLDEHWISGNFAPSIHCKSKSNSSQQASFRD